MVRSRSAIALIIVSSLLSVSTAWAQSRSKANRQRALVLFERSEELYQEGKFQEASVLLREAYELEPEPVLLYNLARSLEANGDLTEALGAYEGYIKQGNLKGTELRSMRSRVEALKKRIEEKERIQRERDEALKQQQETERLLRLQAEQGINQKNSQTDSDPSPLPWIIAGVGAAGLITGGVFFALSNGKHNDAQDAVSQQEAQNLQDESDDLLTVSLVSFIAGGTLAAVGLTWGLIEILGDDNTSSQDDSEASMVLQLQPTGFSLNGRF